MAASQSSEAQEVVTPQRRGGRAGRNNASRPPALRLPCALAVNNCGRSEADPMVNCKMFGDGRRAATIRAIYVRVAETASTRIRVTALEITLFGYNCLRMRGRDAVVVTDPFLNGDGRLHTTADIVTLSSAVDCERRAALVDGAPRAVCGPGEYEIKGVFITGVGTYRDAQSGKERGRNTVYLIELEDLRVCHLGELGHVLSSDQLEEIGTVDVLCVPVGGAPGISPAQAAEVISQLEPSIILPMDWKRPDDSQVTASFDKFCHEMGIKDVEPQPRLSVSKSSLPAEAQVVVLEPKR